MTQQESPSEGVDVLLLWLLFELYALLRRQRESGYDRTMQAILIVGKDVGGELAEVKCGR